MTPSKEEHVLSAAREVFMRYGFKRTTMSDLAEAARMSRPALYLLFSSKEEVFQAVMTRTFTEFLGEVREGVRQRDEVAQQLLFAFDVWCVRPFELTQVAPDAKDLLESGYAFATQITSQAFADFEQVLADVLRPLMSASAETNFSAEHLAHLLTTAVEGFKESASSIAQLRQMISELVTLALAGLRYFRASA